MPSLYIHFEVIKMLLLDIVGPFAMALAIGGAVGLERSHNGHAAGFRTYSLVALASAMLMWVATSAAGWHAAVAGGTMLSDPSRVVQGILTGVGFLGAGVIVKDGFSVKGLTTAASIWVTASLGIMVGSAQYVPAVVATIMTLAALTVFRNVENRIPRRRYVRMRIAFQRHAALTEQGLRDFLAGLGYSVDEISYELNKNGAAVEYHLNMWSRAPTALTNLAEAVVKLPEVIELNITPSKD